jgi:predicted MPP superfamily phosphohydrolase
MAGGRSAARSLAEAALAVTVAGGAALAWASLVERRWYALRRVTVPLLAAGSTPIRVLHLSDLHMAPWQRDKQEWVASLAELAPDLIIDTGDNLGHPGGIEGIQRAFEAFQGVPGAFVNGSNDYFGPTPKNPIRYFRGPSEIRDKPKMLDTDRLTGFFRDELGWLDLNNTARSLTIKQTRLELFGVDDPHLHIDRLRGMTESLESLRASEQADATNAGPDDPAGPVAGTVTGTLPIAVAHAPYARVLDVLVARGARLVFAGHTHGGQVCVPGIGALVTNCDLPRWQAKGLSTWTSDARTSFLHVSAGLGTSIYSPVRFACRPEATLLTLIPRGASRSAARTER